MVSLNSLGGQFQLNYNVTEMAPGDFWRRGAADFTVETSVATLDDLQHVQLTSEQGMDGGNDLQPPTRGHLL